MKKNRNAIPKFNIKILDAIFLVKQRFNSGYPSLCVCALIGFSVMQIIKELFCLVICDEIFETRVRVRFCDGFSLP